MQKYTKWLVILISLMGLVYSQGCARTPPKITADVENAFGGGSDATITQRELQAITSDKISRVRKALSSYSSMKVVRHKTPGFAKVTVADFVIGSAAGAGVGIGGSSGYRMVKTLPAGEKLVEKYDLPDYGELLLRKFVKRASSELPGWPKMIAGSSPVEESYTDTGPFIELHLHEPIFKTFGILSSAGLETRVVVKINRADGSTIFQGTAHYMSKYYGRDRKWKEFEAHNGKVMREEIDFAADAVAKQIVELFKEAR